MSSKSSWKPAKFTEINTSSRYSLANPRISSVDTYQDHPAGRVRLLKYDSWPSNRAMRASMLAGGLIVGTQLTENDEKTQVFRLPMSARPLGYDASVTAKGLFTYDDEEIITDVANLAVEVIKMGNKMGNKNLVISGNLGRLVVITEFTKPGERQLFLAPGTEKMLINAEEGTDPVHHYAGNPTLSGKQFAHGYELFEQVFNETLREG